MDRATTKGDSKMDAFKELLGKEIAVTTKEEEEIERLSALEILSNAIRFWFIQMAFEFDADTAKYARNVIEAAQGLTSLYEIGYLTEAAENLEKDAIERINKASRPHVKKDNHCKRCSGRGKMNEYQHIIDGKCFSCGGTGIEL